LAVAKRHLGPIKEAGRTIGAFAGAEAGEAFLEGAEGLAKATDEEVALWLKAAMEKLDSMVDEATRTRIMMECGFNCARINAAHIERARKKRAKYESLNDFLESEERKPQKGTRMERRGDTIYQYYTPAAFRGGMRCYCGLWRGLPPDQTTSKTWCLCSRGFVMKLWEAYLGKMPDVELLESCISGAAECKFAIRIGARTSQG
jgi:hypothetical protein